MMNPHLEKFFNNSQKILIFLFFGFCLTFPSGYTWSAGLIAILSIIFIFINKRTILNPIDKHCAYLIASFLLMGFLWWHDFNDISSFNDGRLAIKYLLAATSLIFLLNTQNHEKYIKLGVLVGGIPLLILSIYQLDILGRATGFTNAIQFGDISIVFFAFSCIYAVNCIKDKNTTLLILSSLSAIGFLGASLLSLSRGGWIFIAFIPLFVLPIIKLNKYSLLKFFLLFLIVSASAVATPIFQSRIKDAANEAKNYYSTAENASITSIGQRLEQWKSACLIIEKNLYFGTGQEGYQKEKQNLVDLGLSHPSIMDYGHAHNEIFDMTSRRGLTGLLGLMIFYSIPFFVFVRKFKKNKNNKKIQELSLMGAAVPGSCFIFGLTQVFFAHNSGNLFYLFAIVFIYSAIRKLEIEDEKFIKQ